MAFTTAAQRASLALMPIADGDVSDQDRWVLAGFVQPNPNATTSLNKRAGFLGLDSIVYPDGVIRQNDRMVMAGFFPVIDEEKTTIETFDLTWEIGPTWTRVLSSATGLIDAEMNLFVSSMLGESTHPPVADTFYWVGFHTLMNNDPITRITYINDQVSGKTTLKTFMAAKSYMHDSLYFKTISNVTPITGQSSRLQLETGDYLTKEDGGFITVEPSGYVISGIVPMTTRIKDTLCGVTCIKDHFAAQVSHPFTVQEPGAGVEGPGDDRPL